MRKPIGLRSCTPREKWSAVWIVWLSYFTIAETLALRSGHDDAPLSALCRRVLLIRHDRTQRGLGQLVLGAGIVWFVRHIYGAVSE